jgi:hypothetical protein
MEEVKNQKKERTVNQIRITSIEEFYTQQAIKLQDVVLYNSVEGETLETNVDSARVNTQAGEVPANNRGVTMTKRENGTTNNETVTIGKEISHCTSVTSKCGDLALQVGGVSDETVE